MLQIPKRVCDITTGCLPPQVRFHPNPHYMMKQLDITVDMRAILVDWLVEVAEEFKLEQQTFYMALTIVDRYCKFINASA